MPCLKFQTFVQAEHKKNPTFQTCQNTLPGQVTHLGNTELGGLDFAGEVPLGSCPEFTEAPDRESCAGTAWF